MPITPGAASAARLVMPPASVTRARNGQWSRRANCRINRLNPAARQPISRPANMMRGTSGSDWISINATLNGDSVPNKASTVSEAATAAMITGRKLAIVYSIITTSMAKMTPAMGVLKELASAAAVPQATSVLMPSLGSRSHWPSRLAAAAPKWMAGPSRPPDWPESSAAAPPKNCTAALLAGSRPRRSLKQAMTWGTPTRRCSRLSKLIANPMAMAPANGRDARCRYPRDSKASESPSQRVNG